MPLKYSFKYNLEDIYSRKIRNDNYICTKIFELFNNPSDAVDIILIDSIKKEQIDISFFKNYMLNRYLYVNKFIPILDYILIFKKEIDLEYVFSRGDYNTLSLLCDNLNIIKWDKLSFNMNNKVIDFLFEHEDKVDWNNFSCRINKYKIPFFKNNLDKVNWDALFHIHLILDYESNLFIREHIDKIRDWNYLTFTQDEYICTILIENIDKLNDWGIGNLCSMPYEVVVNYFINNQNKINWENFSLNNNKNAVELLSKNIEKINWENFSLNTNNKAIEILKEHLDKLNIINFLMNPNQLVIDFLNEIIDEEEYFYGYINLDILKDNIHILKSNKNPNIIDVIYKICNKYNLDFSNHINYSNPGIFKITYDYEYLKKRMETSFKEELMAFIWNPQRYYKWPEDIFNENY
jgi:hypothetical protein